jgi:2-polyprenyl-3-methyl-5-hydroxy-6-metoxy-1,4-benzoquinol methylase
MEEKEKKFKKYNVRGADYHWRQINKRNLLRFNAYLFARYQIVVEEIKKILATEPTKLKTINLIDLGCGDGVQVHLINEFLKKEIPHRNIFGIDVSDDALSIAQEKNTKGIFKNESVYATTFPDNFFDFTVSSDVIEHVQDPQKMVSEAVRITKKGGHIIIGTPIKFTEKPLDKMHVHEFFPHEFRKLFESDDVEITRAVQSHPFFYYVLYAKTFTWFGRKKHLFVPLINIFSSLTGKNPFLKSQSGPDEPMSYQYIILKKL